MPRYVLPMPLPTLLGSLHVIWASNQMLCNMVPPARVITGRLPSTQIDRMPYVSVEVGKGHRDNRTNVSQRDIVPVTFTLWVSESCVAVGEIFELAISDAYANSQWRYFGGRVDDVLDDGPASKLETANPECHYWEIVKVFSICTERCRADVARGGTPKTIRIARNANGTIGIA